VTPWLPVAILAAPLAVATFLLFAGRRLHHGGDLFATLVMAACFVGSLALAAQVVPTGAMVAGPHAAWLSFSSWHLGLGIALDPMAAIMLCIVTGLATAVMVYTRWYLHDDPLYARFWWSFSFFCFAMIGIVVADNLLMTFICWELVGLGSYFLIGFWWHKPTVADDPHYQDMKAPWATGIIESKLSPADAQLKAFVMNRIGDAGFIAGIAIVAWAVLAGGNPGDPLSWASIEQAVQTGAFDRISLAGLSGGTLLTLAGIGIFCGAIGKSAQFPLHTWLPDAMQGPTTGSAIIHAATMVAAGVFLVARVHPMLTPDALLVVALVGSFTAFIAAAMATVQWDLKAVLAYSTISQLGFMLTGLGSGVETGGWNAGVAHLFTHAIFKCLLFLCAAAVIHACHGQQSLHKVGGLARKMPVTAAAMGLAVLAICGVPGFSAFYSKDGILAAALVAGQHGPHGWLGWMPAILATSAAALTCYYMARLWFRLFIAPAGNAHAVDHAHDPWPSAKAVLIVLAIGTLQIVWTGSLNPFAEGAWLDHALSPHAQHHGEALAHAHHTVVALAIAFAVIGIGIAYVVWVVLPARGIDLAGNLARGALRPLWLLLSKLFFLEYIYDAIAVRLLGKGLGRSLAEADLGTAERLSVLGADPPRQLAWYRRYASLDGTIDAVGALCSGLGRAGAALHAGRIATYVAVAAAVTAAALLVLL
jgi:NADH-quinone oxidoreductase subunit L